MASEEIIIKVKTDTKNADKGLDNIKKSAKGAGDEAKNAAGQFSIMGVSINGLSTAFNKVKGVSKLMFSSIKMGIASTGIGLLVLAVGALVTYFTQTKKGAETLQVAFKAIGATISVLTDRISAIGGAIIKVFSGDFKGAAEDAKAAVSGLGEEIANETKAMIELTRTLQRVKDAERDFSKERAQTNQVIAEARLLAEDETASYEDRIAALKTANELEIATTEKAIALQKEKLEATRTEVELGESLAEDLDRLAAEEVKLIEMQTASFSKRKRLMTAEDTLKTEMETAQRQRDADEAKRKEEIAANELAITKKKNAVLDELELLRAENAEEKELIALEQQQEKAALEIEALVATEEQKQELLLASEESFNLKKADIDAKYREKDKADRDKIEADKDKKRADDLAKEKKLADSKMALAQGTLSLIQDVFGKESKAGKAAAIAQATINTYQGITAALASAPPPINVGLAGITAAAGFKSVADIVGTQEPKFARGGMVGGFGTGTSDSVSAKLSKGETVINAKSTRMFKPLLSAMNEAGGGVGFADGGTLDTSSNGQTFGAIKAFVVTDDVTNSQNSLDKIRQKATI